MQQQRLDFDGDGNVPNWAETGVEADKARPELSAVHRATEEVLQNRYGDRYIEHLAAAMARYLDWTHWRMQQRKDAKAKAIQRAAAKRIRSRDNVPHDDGVVDVPAEE